jgi:hypothetical protein
MSAKHSRSQSHLRWIVHECGEFSFKWSTDDKERLISLISCRLPMMLIPKSYKKDQIINKIMWKTHAWFNLILDTPKHVDTISTKQQVKQVILMLHHSSKFNLASVWASWVIYSWSDWLISPYHPWIIWKKIL